MGGLLRAVRGYVEVCQAHPLPPPPAKREEEEEEEVVVGGRKEEEEDLGRVFERALGGFFFLER